MGTDLDRIKLKYLGGGSLHGVPARDLSGYETDLFGGVGLLTATGLYAEAESPAAVATEEQKPEIKIKPEANNDRRVKKIK
jgi:hypothetical protein